MPATARITTNDPKGRPTAVSSTRISFHTGSIRVGRYPSTYD
jgi:hypothetical protein